MFDSSGRESVYRRYGKRVLDLSLVLATAILWAPLTAAVALLVRAGMGRPIFFTQERPGYLGRPFRLYKFRTMTGARDDAGALLPDAMRMTRLGSWLRRFSLDELPELWNVLRGDMSLVGPRPLLMEYLDRYTAEQFRRHETRPGLTGLAQIEGRNAVSWEERFALDVEYVDRCSLPLDLWILARTVPVALSGRGVSAAGHATMPDFHNTGGPGR